VRVDTLRALVRADSSEAYWSASRTLYRVSRTARDLMARRLLVTTDEVRDTLCDVDAAPFSTLARVIIRTGLQGLYNLSTLTQYANPDVSALAVEACEDETALFPLRDRLEELGLDASLLTCLLPPRPAPVVVEDESGIPY
jgi:hypothetical protein